jgi:hypothetical protein
VNGVTRKLISARNELKKKTSSKLKEIMAIIREIKGQNAALKALVKSQLFLGMSELAKLFTLCLI